MLTDIFACRYSDTPMFEKFEEKDRRFIVQAFRIVSEQLYPYYINGDESPKNKKNWKLFNDKLSTELGLTSLSEVAYAFQTTYMGKAHVQTGINTPFAICEKFVLAQCSGTLEADRFIKERISFIEIAFQHYENSMPKPDNQKEPVDTNPAVYIAHITQKNLFSNALTELNTRFRQAGYKLNYHNGLIQCSNDSLIESKIETPFWELIYEPKWRNVDIDIKEALDLRDTSGRDPAFYAAKALESTIKIISDDRSWTTGSERGAINYINNLKSNNYIDTWEKEILTKFFGDIRNPFGHGAGNNKMPVLSGVQTDWAIGFCMLWIKSLIQRLNISSSD